MSTERSYRFTYLLQVPKKSLWSLILYNCFHDLIHVHSPGAGILMSAETLSLRSYVASFYDNSFWKIHCFTFFPYKSIRDKIWPCCKIGQGQSRVIIWANLLVLVHLVMHTKIQDHQPFGSGEEDFLRFLPYMGLVAILVMWPGPFGQTFVPPSHRSSIWNLNLTGPVVSEEKIFKECGRRRTTT